MRNLLKCCLVFFINSCATTTKISDKCLSGVNIGGSCKPLRSGVIVLNPYQDKVKPLAPLTYSGFSLAQDTIIGAIDHKVLTSFSLRTNSFQWWKDLDSEISGPINTYGKWTVASTRSGKLIKIDSLTGKTLWSVDLGRFSDRKTTFAEQSLYLQTPSNQIFSIDVNSGNKKWVYDAGAHDSKITIRNGAKPVFHKNRVIMGTSQGEIHVIDSATGRLTQRISPNNRNSKFQDVIGDIIVDSNTIQFARYDGLVSKVLIGAKDNQKIWEIETPSISATAFREGVYYIGCINGTVIAINSRTGKTLWKQQTDQSISSISLGEKVIFTTGSKGRIAALDAAKGEFQWLDNIHSTLDSKPILFGKMIYVPTGLASLYRYKI